MLYLAKRLDDVLTSLYDYEYIDIEKFYNDNDNKELLTTLDNVLNKNSREDTDHRDLHDLFTNLAYFIRFETNYNSTIGDF